ncbi:MAG: ribosome silencing factor [bacterium]|nr:ribosome silencing factor [bacterium]
MSFMTQEVDEREAKVRQIKKEISSEEILSTVLVSLEDKQGEEVQCFNIAEVSSVADYMVVSTATSSTHSRVLAEVVRYQCKKRKYQHLNNGQADDENWTILDYGSVVVHLQNREARERYRLHDLWKDGVPVNIQSHLDEFPTELID